MRRGFCIVGTAAALVAVPAAETDGATEYFAWSQNSRAHRTTFDAFLTRTGDARIKLNTKGHGYVGGIDPPMVAYQQVVNGNSDLKLYDADAQTRTTRRPASTPSIGNGSRASRETGSCSAARRAACSSSSSAA